MYTRYPDQFSLFFRYPVGATPHGWDVIAGGNQSTQSKHTVFGNVKLEDALLTSDWGNFNWTGAPIRTLTPYHQGERHIHYHHVRNTPKKIAHCTIYFTH